MTYQKKCLKVHVHEGRTRFQTYPSHFPFFSSPSGIFSFHLNGTSTDTYYSTFKKNLNICTTFIWHIVWLNSIPVRSVRYRDIVVYNHCWFSVHWQGHLIKYRRCRSVVVAAAVKHPAAPLVYVTAPHEHRVFFHKSRLQREKNGLIGAADCTVEKSIIASWWRIISIGWILVLEYWRHTQYAKSGYWTLEDYDYIIALRSCAVTLKNESLNMSLNDPCSKYA